MSILLSWKGEKEKRMSEEEENMTATIGIRVLPSFKQWAKEKAEERGETLSDFLWSLIDAGVNQISQNDPPLKE